MPLRKFKDQRVFHPGDTIAYRWRKYEFDKLQPSGLVHLRPVGRHEAMTLDAAAFVCACCAGEISLLREAPHSLRVDPNMPPPVRTPPSIAAEATDLVLA
jgi:hypothetical protein